MIVASDAMPPETLAPPRGIKAGTVTALIALVAVAAVGMATAIPGGLSELLAMQTTLPEEAPQPQQAEASGEEVAAMSVDDKAQILAEGADAEAQNAAIPVSGEPVQVAPKFLLSAAPSTYQTALKCLTQAIYYEAAVEPLQGRRAVAQVVLNRMRHPAYPKSVCGVVYQGSERQTGCQFSFTCDGSLLRQPMARPWREAQDVARAALAGYVEKSVGTATHYHADYVLPKWAFNLAKIEQLGRHIFYRFNAGWGRPQALSGRYSGFEAIPSYNLEALRARLLAAGETGEGAYVPGLTVTPHVTDRHAEADVGGRIDTTKQWRLAIPDPTDASARYRTLVAQPEQHKAAGAELAAANDKNTVNP